MQAEQAPASKLMFVTPDKESSMKKKEFEQICRRKSLTEKAADIENPIGSLWKSTKGNAMISTRQCFAKKNCGIGGRMA
jgi:hypothetical protein